MSGEASKRVAKGINHSRKIFLKKSLCLEGLKINAARKRVQALFLKREAESGRDFDQSNFSPSCSIPA